MAGKEEKKNHRDLASLYAKRLGIPQEKIIHLNEVYQEIRQIIQEIEQQTDQSTIDYSWHGGKLHSDVNIGVIRSKRVNKIVEHCYQLHEFNFFTDEEYYGLQSTLINAIRRWCMANPKGLSSLWGQNFSSDTLRKDALMIHIYFLVAYHKHYSSDKRTDYQSISAYLKQHHELDMVASQLSDRFRKCDHEVLRWKYDLFRLEACTPSGKLSDPRITKLPSWQSMHPPADTPDYTLDLTDLISRWYERKEREKQNRQASQSDADKP